MSPVPAARISAPTRALDSAERQAVLDALHPSRFQDCSPTEVGATLRDEGIYLASERTFYHLLAAEGETRARAAISSSIPLTPLVPS